MLDSASNINFYALFELAKVLNRQTDFNETLRLVADKTNDILVAESVSIMMFNPSTHETVKTVLRHGKKVTDSGLKSLQSQLTGWMLHNQPSLISCDIRQDSRFENLEMTGLLVQCAIGVLLKVEKSLLGSIVVFRTEKAGPFAESDLPVLEYIAAIAAPYLRNMEEIRQFFAPGISENALLKKYSEIGLIGASQEFIELLHAIEAAVRCDVRVVLEGESGTGKELIARAIHRFSDRKARPFIVVDCGAISEHLLESELFGHKKGAFTGATQDRKGLIEEADSGTLFIDEITSLPLEMQMKFMRFLQEGEVRPVGTNIPRGKSTYVLCRRRVNPCASSWRMVAFEKTCFFDCISTQFMCYRFEIAGRILRCWPTTFLRNFPNSKIRKFTHFIRKSSNLCGKEPGRETFVNSKILLSAS